MKKKYVAGAEWSFDSGNDKVKYSIDNAAQKFGNLTQVMVDNFLMLELMNDNEWFMILNGVSMRIKILKNGTTEVCVEDGYLRPMGDRTLLESRPIELSDLFVKGKKK